MDLDSEWLEFQNSINNNITTDNHNNKIKVKQKEIPKCSEIYISTQTKIAYLNTHIDLYKIFWELPILKYFNPQNGIIKKSIKINCNSIEEVVELEKKIEKEKKEAEKKAKKEEEERKKNYENKKFKLK